jgi:hypothetical protein
MYLAVATRPDIAFAVAYVSRFLEKPKERHWSAVKRIFKYLRGTSALSSKLTAIQILPVIQTLEDLSAE